MLFPRLLIIALILGLISMAAAICDKWDNPRVFIPLALSNILVEINSYLENRTSRSFFVLTLVHK